MEPVLKTGDSARDRGFESLTLRHNISNPNRVRYVFVNGLFGCVFFRV